MTKLVVWGENLAYRIGGAERSTYLLVQRLSSLPGLDVTAVSGTRPDGDSAFGRYPYPNLATVPAVRLRYGLRFLQFALNSPAIRAYFAMSRADLLLANAQSAPAAIEGFAGPSVYFIHDELSLGVYRSYERRLAKRIRFAGRYALDWPFFRAYCVRNRRAMRRAKLVVANSRYVAAMAKTRLGIEAAVVYPQVDVEALSRVVLAPVAERRAIMMVGDQEVKGTSTMRAIARAMPEEQFLMVGRSYTERRDGNVTFRGFVENPVSHYRQAKLVLMPSTWEEGFGMVSVEAAALGIPTLVSDRGGLPETVPSRDSVVSEYRSAPRWVEKIRAVLADYDRFSRAAREHAKGLDGRAQAERLVEEIRRATGIDLSRSGR